MLECKNVKSEKVAKHLLKMAESFKLWTHDNTVYANFDIESLELRELSKRLKRIKSIDFRFIKIRTLVDYGT